MQFENQYLNLPSPVEELHDHLFDEKQLRVFVKRDDLIHTIISGNKWRKLREYIQLAQHTGAKQVISFGGAYSNHLYALAYTAHKIQIPCVGIVRGDELSKESNPFLNQMHEWGMELHFILRSNYQNKIIPTSIDTNESLLISEGGFGIEAIKGIEHLCLELSSQEEIDHIFCPIGTGATYLGLCAGQIQSRVHGVLTLNNRSEIFQNACDLSIPLQEIHENYVFGKYAKQTDELDQFCATFWTKHKLKIEPIYTGRMFYGLYDLIKTDYFKPGSRIMALHTGGMKD